MRVWNFNILIFQFFNLICLIFEKMTYYVLRRNTEI